MVTPCRGASLWVMEAPPWRSHSCRVSICVSWCVCSCLFSNEFITRIKSGEQKHQTSDSQAKKKLVGKKTEKKHDVKTILQKALLLKRSHKPVSPKNPLGTHLCLWQATYGEKYAEAPGICKVTCLCKSLFPETSLKVKLIHSVS